MTQHPRCRPRCFRRRWRRHPHQPVERLADRVSNNAISAAAGGQERFADPVAIDRKGNNAYVTDYGGKPSRVIKVNLTTGKQSLLSGGKNIGDPLGIDTGLSKALVADAGSRKSDLRLSGGLIEVDFSPASRR